MIYKIVDSYSGKNVNHTSEMDINQLKKELRCLNTGSYFTGRGVIYAIAKRCCKQIACYLPDEALVSVDKSIYPTPIKDLTAREREVFWNYYATNSSWIIPCSEFQIGELTAYVNNSQQGRGVK